MLRNPIPGADFLPLSDLAVAQAERWAHQLECITACSPFFRNLWGSKRPPKRLEELPELPLTDKEMLRADQCRHSPFGSYLAAIEDVVRRVHRTSGTTGQAINLALSEADAALAAQVGARAQSAAGLGPGHRVIHCLNYQLWMGRFTDHASLEATRATVIPFGVGFH